MATRAKEDVVEEIKKDVDVALVVVHGVGQQLRGDSLVEWAEPLYRRMDELSRRAGHGGAEISHADIVGDDAAEIRITADVGGKQSRTIKITEARWAEAFLVQSPTTVILWSIRFVGRVLIRLIAHAFRLALTIRPLRLFDASTVRRVNKLRKTPPGDRREVYQKRDLLYNVLVRLPGALVILVGYVVVVLGSLLGVAAMSLVFSVVPLLLTVFLVLLGTLSYLPGFGSKLRPLLSGFTSLVGDASVFTSSPVAAAAMRDVVRASVKRARADADRVVVVAHSQGAAVTARAVARHDTPEEAKVDALITVGAATSLLRGPLGADRRDPRWRPIAAWAQSSELNWVNIWGIWDPVAAGPLVDKRPPDLGSRWKQVFGPNRRFTEAGWRWREFVGRYRHREQKREELFNERSQPLPTVLSREQARAAIARAKQLREEIGFELDAADPEWLASFPGPVGPEERAASNRGSLLTDHPTYSSNILEVVDPIARVLLGPTFESDERSPARVKERERHRRAVSSMAQNRLFAAAAAVLVAPDLLKIIHGWGWVSATLDYSIQAGGVWAKIGTIIRDFNLADYIVVSAIFIALFFLFSRPVFFLWQKYEQALTSSWSEVRIKDVALSFHVVRAILPLVVGLYTFQWLNEFLPRLAASEIPLIAISVLYAWPWLLESVGLAPLRRVERVS